MSLNLTEFYDNEEIFQILDKSREKAENELCDALSVYILGAEPVFATAFRKIAPHIEMYLAEKSKRLAHIYLGMAAHFLVGYTQCDNNEKSSDYCFKISHCLEKSATTDPDARLPDFINTWLCRNAQGKSAGASLHTCNDT